MAGILFLGGAAAAARLQPADRALDAHDRYAIAANKRIKIDQRAVVEGNVHANDVVELKKGSRVTGEVSAVKEVKNQGGSVIGPVIQRAPVLALPVTPGRNEARALADRVVAGPLKLMGPRIDDVLFVTGAVTIEGAVQGAGTLIATGTVTVTAGVAGTPPPGGGGSGGAASAPRLSILTYGDLTLGARATLRATARVRGRAVVGERAAFEGSLIADQGVELAKTATVRFGPRVDVTAPALTILGPVDPLVTAVPAFDLAVLYADADPGIDLASFALHLDGAAVTDRCSVGDHAATCSLAVPGSGHRLVTASIRDRAGNTATQTLAFTAVLDVEAPALAIESPLDGALVAAADVVVSGTVGDDGAIALVTVDGAVVEPSGGRFAWPVILRDGVNVLRVVARDSTGKESERSVAVTLDRVPPRVTLRSPASPVVATNLPSILVAGDAEDDQELAAIEVAGAALPPGDGGFEREVALQEGDNRVRVAATDRAGNVGAVELEVERLTVPRIVIVAPEDGTLVHDQTLDVSGTVDDPAAIVTVNGERVALSGTTFLYPALPIPAGATLINVVATGATGLQSTAGVTVVRDLTPPSVAIHDPADGTEVYAPEVAVRGMVNDVVVGTVNAAQVTVTVNGIAAEVSNRSFLLDRLPLQEGENVVTVEAIDPSGNVGRGAVTVRRGPPAVRAINLLSGNGQTAIAGEALPQPLAVVLRDEIGAPVAGQAVSFVADGSDGTFEGGRRQLVLTTDAAGRAAVALTLGRRAGHHSVRATAVGFAGEAVFVARALADEPALLVVDSGDQQMGVSGQELRAPLAVVVTDQGFNRLESVAVRFEVLEGGGSFAGGETAIDLVSDSDGRVTARLVLGPEEGVGNNVARAHFAGSPAEEGVTFAASAMVEGDPASTTVSGVVLDNTDQPVPGATVSLEGTELTTRSDASGFFRLSGAPPGTTHLRVRGATVERPGVWPSLEFLITIISGRDNDMGRPVFLPQLDPQNALAVGETTGGVLTMRDLPGFGLHVAPGSVTFPGGGRSGVLTVTPVHGDKVPMPPNFGQQPRFVITIQPGGARFDPPAPVTYPNVDGLAPGQVTELYSFDHDLARFVSIGPGTVTGDGTRIESNPGVGIAKAGWHAGGDPARPGTCHDCAECKSQSGGACVADDAAVPSQKAPDDCRREICLGGKVVSQMTNQESARKIEGNCYEELCPQPHRAVDLADEPPGLKCCGDPAKPLPGGMSRGVLTGTYDPEAQCCVEGGPSIISKRAPIDLSRCPRPVPPETPIDVEHDGCSVPVFASFIALGDPYTPYSGKANEPTPPAQGDALFSHLGTGEDPPAGPCDRHDRCYQTCGSDQGGCDQAFGSDLEAACAGLTGTVPVPAPSGGFDIQLDRMELCEIWASRYTVAVSQAGGPAHRDGQSSHCDCECS